MNKSDKRIETYKSMVSDKLPYKSQSGLTIDEIDGECPCGVKLQQMKYKINDFGNCVEILPMGICQKCMAVVECKKLRRYSDGRVMWLEDDGWYEPVESLWDKIRKLCHGI